MKFEHESAQLVYVICGDKDKIFPNVKKHLTTNLSNITGQECELLISMNQTIKGHIECIHTNQILSVKYGITK